MNNLQLIGDRNDGTAFITCILELSIFMRAILIFAQSISTDVKIKREHVKGSDSGETKPQVEPITEETVRRMEYPGSVEVCKSSGKS